MTFENAYQFADFCRGKLNNPFFLDLAENIDKLRSGDCCQGKGFSRAVGAKYAMAKDWLTENDKNIISISADLDWVILKHMNSEIIRF